MTTSAVWKETYRIHSYEVDRNGNTRPDLLLSFMLDSAWSHVRRSEFSFDSLRDDGQFWVLSRFLALFHRIPRWDDVVSIETWGRGIDRLFALRDFLMLSEKGETLVSATSSWLILDRQTLRPQRLDRLKERFPLPSARAALDRGAEKIAGPALRMEHGHHTVTFSDIDVNQHLNSARYMEWILDGFPHDVRAASSLSSFEINFLAEAQLGDRVTVYTEPAGNLFLSEIRRDRDEAPLCRALTGWSGQRIMSEVL